MARHRSPSGRRAHHGFSLSAVPAAAGAGGAPSVPVPGPMPARIVTAVLTGGVLAAVGQHALTETLPDLVDDGGTLNLSLQQALGGPPQAAAVAAPLPAVDPVAAAPSVVDASDLIKAADLQRAAAEAAEAARVAEAERLAEEARAAEAARIAAEAEAAAKTASGGGVQMVVGRISSGFGLRSGTTHRGIDIAAPIGTDIRVPFDGTVIDSGPANGFGLWIRVRHEDGTITVYGHIDRSLVDVGERVEAGQHIADVGNRGESTGPHLHFEVIASGGSQINPRPWLDEHGIGVT